nr:MAG TPA: hypothetical protein [Caudoviricetes sp.]
MKFPWGRKSKNGKWAELNTFYLLEHVDGVFATVG